MTIFSFLVASIFIVFYAGTLTSIEDQNNYKKLIVFIIKIKIKDKIVKLFIPNKFLNNNKILNLTAIANYKNIIDPSQIIIDMKQKNM